MLYHVTFAHNLPSIRRIGLLPGLRPVWAKRDGTAYTVGSYVYVFESRIDAVRWAGKMGWEWYQDSASPKIAIVTIDDPYGWQEDGNDPLLRSASVGKWYRRNEAVKRSAIVKVERLTREMIKQVSIKTVRTAP